MQAGPDRRTVVVDAITSARARRPAHADTLSAWRWRRAARGSRSRAGRPRPSRLRREAHAVYTAALDQEAQAAEMLRLAVG